MSIAAKTYYFSCGFFYNILQLYYEFYETKNLRMHKLSDKYGHWNSVYHSVLGWLLEEVAFPFHYENPSAIEITALTSLDGRGEEIALLIYEQIIAESNAAHIRLNIDMEVFVYYFFCNIASGLLAKFDAIMNTEPVAYSEYSTHYHQDIDLFRELTTAFRGETDGIENPILKNWQESIAPDIMALTDKWVETVYSVVRQAADES